MILDNHRKKGILMSELKEGSDMAKTSDAMRKSIAKYDAAHTVQVKLKLNIETDSDILQQLDNVQNKQGYIKALIREDMRKG